MDVHRDGHALLREAEPLGGRFDDPHVRLVHDEQVDVGGRHAGFLKRPLRHARNPGHSQAVDVTSDHPDGVIVVGVRLRRHPLRGAARWSLQQVRVLPVIHHREGQQSRPRLARPQQHRPRSIAEQHARAAVGPIGGTCQSFRSDHEDVLVGPILDELGPRCQGRHESRAALHQVERSRALRPDGLLNKAGRRGERHVRRHRRHDDQAHIRGVHPGVLQTRACRTDGHVGGGLVVGDDTPLADACPLDDPLVACVQLRARLKLLVR